ncbi:hypothetical protein FQ186_16850 [Pseudomonas sp. ANT_H14]|uniref:TRAFAC clade GTPase domain-containing protein n=1 Tax=unclassified Pseudomonas TaxID=196821 RepID=UPI0011ED9FB7|nr:MULTISPECIES: hypothetical protein [unclassified Pseudomonas]KAA0950162.1 hypothetical protein FQ182_00025 [Pseudomonas sp. ANT_H4]KAA0951439.1 hypothetical protein FQ186_16850 [Pseudomonas sp. ANT_H14]
MSEHSIILVGGPDSGKTNFLAPFWESIRSKKGDLIAKESPKNIKYIEEALAHLLKGEFAPRSEMDLEETNLSFCIPVTSKSRPSESTHLVVPDIRGEVWKEAVETCEIPEQWMTNLRNASGALLFIRIGSQQNEASLDWVTAAGLLRMPLIGDSVGHLKIPAQVATCELIRFLEHSLAADLDGVKPTVAILITAWDLLDEEASALGPLEYLKKEYPMVAGRIDDIESLNIGVFGVSSVGGDFVDDDFKQRYLEDDCESFGYVIHDVDGKVERIKDITLPIGWMVNQLKRVV